MHPSTVISRLTGIYSVSKSPDDVQQDDEANYFARGLLMPAELVQKELDKLGGLLNDYVLVVDHLADTFGVDPALMAMRLVEIGAEVE